MNNRSDIDKDENDGKVERNMSDAENYKINDNRSNISANRDDSFAMLKMLIKTSILWLVKTNHLNGVLRHLEEGVVLYKISFGKRRCTQSCTYS